MSESGDKFDWSGVKHEHGPSDNNAFTDDLEGGVVRKELGKQTFADDPKLQAFAEQQPNEPGFEVTGSAMPPESLPDVQP